MGTHGKRHEGLAGSRILEGNEERRKVRRIRPWLAPRLVPLIGTQPAQNCDSRPGLPRFLVSISTTNDISFVQWYFHRNPSHKRTASKPVAEEFHSAFHKRLVSPGSGGTCGTTCRRVISQTISGLRRGARVAESGSLENCCPGNGTVGSIPTLSAKSGLPVPLASLAHLSCSFGLSWLFG